jgi:cytidylate kinase
MTTARKPLIGIVGPCASGKTTLHQRLLNRGFNVRHIAQEHSYVQYMWEKITNPDVLIFLTVSYQSSINRRKLNWTLSEYNEQLFRLRHAREHANLMIDTDKFSPEEIEEIVIDSLIEISKCTSEEIYK